MHSLWLYLLCLTLGTTISKMTGLVKVAVISQVGDDQLSYLFNDPSSLYTWIDGSTVDFIQMGGTMPIIVKLGTPLDEVKDILDEVDAIVLPSGTIASENSALYQKYVRFIVNYAIKKNLAIQANPNAPPMPVLAYGTSLIPFLLSFADELNKKPPVIDCTMKDTNTTHSMVTNSAAIYQNALFQQLGRFTKCASESSMYFNHGCGVEVNAMKDLRDEIGILATYVLSGKTYAGVLVHKSMPFTAVQFDPSKTTYTRTINRNQDVVSQECARFVSQLAIQWLDSVRSTAKPIKDSSTSIRKLFMQLDNPWIVATNGTERVYSYKTYSLPFN